VRADFDSTANAVSIALTDASHADQSDDVHARAVVALAAGTPVEVQVLYPDLGVDEPLSAVAKRYGLDLEALLAAAQSALAAPDRVVSVEVAARSAA
jgi:2-hydroxychromene-2-carboxylate isomerase